MAETFTQEDQQELDELVARRDRVTRADVEARRAAEAQAFAVVNPVLDLINWDELRPALETAANAPGLSNDTRSRLQRIQQILTFDYEQGLLRERDRLNPPAPPAPAPE